MCVCVCVCVCGLKLKLCSSLSDEFADITAEGLTAQRK